LKNCHPHNPAAKTFSTSSKSGLNLTQGFTSSIALLLPLSGQDQMFTTDIFQGCEATKNGVSADLNASGAGTISTSQQPADQTASSIASITPSQATNNVHVKLCDTLTNQPLATLLNQEQQYGATLMVGPSAERKRRSAF
jgi:outer membrane PBP1 activator LpoA protein